MSVSDCMLDCWSTGPMSRIPLVVVNLRETHAQVVFSRPVIALGSDFGSANNFGGKVKPTWSHGLQS